MKILLRDAETRLFEGESGAWTSEPAEALRFTTLETAGEQALADCEREVEVVLQYEDPPCEMALNPVYCARH